MDFSESNKRIAKNSFLLYLRMLFTMGVSLYTSRLVLSTLGVEDFGIYDVTGGVIAMFSFLNSAMSSATQRYITYALGKGDKKWTSTVFSTSLQIHFVIAIIIVVLGETVGLWFLLNRLVIPEPRMTAAIWVYQCSIITSAISILSVPYNADIIANEKMKAFAYISVLEVTLKLLIVFLLSLSLYDKLIVYALLIAVVQIFLRYIYIQYCSKNFQESKYRHYIDKSLLKEMSSFAGWSFFGNFASVLNGQGTNMMLNIFFGPVINAARGIALQVQSAIQSFASNFQMAINPQITKNYASGNYEQMHSLMFRSARFSFFLLFIIILPVLFETEYILIIWLKTVPENAVAFTRVMLILSLIATFANPSTIANNATGKVKTFQITVGLFLMLSLPLSYFVLKMGVPAYFVFIVQAIINFFAIILRMYLLRSKIHLPVHKYFVNIFGRTSIVALVSVWLPFLIYNYLGQGTIRFLLVVTACFISVTMSIYHFGVTISERIFLKEKAIQIFRKIL